jgi:pimeloyl-ACP methyl ester carboxylesterase
MTRIKYIDNGCSRLAVLLPGWATDYHVFDQLELPYDLIVPVEIDTEDIVEVLGTYIAGKRVTLIGWSLGGLIAGDLMSRYADLVEKAIFIAVKKDYKKEEISLMKRYLQKDNVNYLEMFYRRCLNGHEENEKNWFNNNLKARYIDNFKRDVLIRHLDYFIDNPFPAEALAPFWEKIVFVAGDNDKVVPLERIYDFIEFFPETCFWTIKGAGHLCFMNERFKREVF